MRKRPAASVAPGSKRRAAPLLEDLPNAAAVEEKIGEEYRREWCEKGCGILRKEMVCGAWGIL